MEAQMIYKKPSLIEKAKFRLEQIRKAKEKILLDEKQAEEEFLRLSKSGGL